ncbi:nucleoside hydrolase [Pseudomonas laurentiana]
MCGLFCACLYPKDLRVFDLTVRSFPACPCNATAAAEFNFWFDPEAAEILLAAGLDTVLLPLDAIASIRHSTLLGTGSGTVIPLMSPSNCRSRAASPSVTKRSRLSPWTTALPSSTIKCVLP